MNEARRCIYNAVRDRATGHNGVACFTSYDELGDICQTNRRQAMALSSALVIDQFLHRVSLRTTLRHCFVPLDPDPERTKIVLGVMAEMAVRKAVIVAYLRVAFLFAQGRDVTDICRVITELRCPEIAAFGNDLFALGFWRK